MPKQTPSNERNRIRQYRLASGLNQSELAEKSGIGLSTLARYESVSFLGRIPAKVQTSLAKALNQPIENIFTLPSQQEQRESMSRRQFLGGVGASALGVGLGIEGGMAGMEFAGTIWGNHNRQSLSDDEIRILAESNFAAWELFDNLQRGSTADYVSAVAQGKLVTLKHLANCSLPTKQKETVLLFLGDMYLIMGRLAREAQNFGAGEYYFNQAMLVAQEINNADLKAATRQRYGFMLIDQGRFGAAVRNGEAALVESKGASFPIWAEAQVIAAHAFAHAGRYREAQHIAYTARDATPGPDPDMWIGKATNPRTIYAFFDIIANLASQRNYEAVQAAENTIANLDKEQPENLQWRVHIQTMQATALWELGAVDDAAMVATDSLKSTRAIGSVINESRIEGLHQKMRTSIYAKHPLVRELGEMIMTC